MACCSDRLNNAKVYIVHSNEEALCGGVGNMFKKATVEVDCGGRVGSKVTIRIEGVEKILTLCEVEVWGRLAGEYRKVQ